MASSPNFRPVAVNVEALDGYEIKVTFNDGVEVQYNLAPIMGQGVFRRLQPRHHFEWVQVGQAGRSVGWPDPEGTIEPLIDIGSDTIRRKGRGVSGTPSPQADEVFWRGEVPALAEFDADPWVASLVDTFTVALAPLGQTEVGAQSIFVHGEHYELRVDLWLAPFPSPPGVEARISWALRCNELTVDGETDVQPDDTLAVAREHVLEEIQWGLSEIGADE